jgi:flagellar M-ring protein FliF
MPQFDLERLKTQARQFASGFTPGQKVVTVVAIVAVVGGAFLLSQLSSSTSYTTLFTDLQPADASRITGELDGKGVDYELADGGATIRVPDDQVYQLRIDLSAQGLPTGGSGYELLDDQGITTSEFKQRIDYQRALQGELSRTISAMDGVDAATVHLVIPRDDVFLEDEQRSTASVLVRSEPSANLSSSKVQAIVHLVASSVDGLSAESVTVADAAGRILWTPGPDGGLGSTDAGESQTAQYETGVASELQQVLDRVLGPGRAVVAVQATLDFDKRSTTTETFENPSTNPANPVPPIEEHTINEQLQGGNGGGGVLGVDGTTAAGGGTGSNYQKDEATRHNALNRTVEEVQGTPGAVQRQSVSVLLDADNVPADQVAALEDSVVAAAGINLARGDLLDVARVPFDDTVARAAKAELESAETDEGSGGLTSMLKGGAALILVLVVLALLWRSTRRAAARRPPVRVPLDLRELEGFEPLPRAPSTEFELPVGAARPADIEVAEFPAPKSLEIHDEIAELVDRQPEDVGITLRSWLAERRS